MHPFKLAFTLLFLAALTPIGAAEIDELKLNGKPEAQAEQPPQPSRVRRPAAKAAPAQAIAFEQKSGESLDDAWDRILAARATHIDSAKDRPAALKKNDAAIRQTVRELMAAEKYESAAALITAALRAGQSQPWMYEGLSLALRAMKAPEEDIERALLSGVDLSDDADSAMMIALYMSKAGLERSALRLYQQLAAAFPSRPEPYVQGLACAKFVKDREGIMWACEGILSRAWGREHLDVERDALRQARGMILELQKAGDEQLAADFEGRLNKALVRDCWIVISWTGDADLDLLVQEPSGETCSLENPRTTGGGVLVGDSYSGDQQQAGGMREGYVCPLGFSGEYKVVVKRVWGKVTAGSVTVDIYTKEKHLREQLSLGEKESVFAFDLADGRRQEPQLEEKLANVQRRQLALNRQVLAQQLGQFDQSAAARAYAAALAAQNNGGVNPALAMRFGPGAVGFTIRPTILTEGLSDFTRCVISADRRYVRVTPQPSITAIGQVTTFNVRTGQTNNITNQVNGNNNNGGGLGGGLGGGGFGT